MLKENYSEKEIRDLERKYAVQSYDTSRLKNPLIIEKAEGVFLWDKNGKRYLDFSAEYSSSNVGFQNKEMIEAIKKQLKLISVSSMFIHPLRVQLAELLDKITPKDLSKSYFGCTGSDAIDAALKFARKYTKEYKVLSLWEGYHGATFGALSAHGLTYARFDFEPLLPGFIHVSPPYCYRCDFGLKYPDCGLVCLNVLEKTIVREGHVAAIILEPILAGGGVIIPPKPYMQGLKKICEKYNILLIFDEVCTGFGRTGKMFCCEQYNVVPDMLVVAKGFTSGYLPGSAVIVSKDLNIYDPEKSGEPVHYHTLSASPLTCAVAITNINIILRDKLAENAAKIGKYLIESLQEIARESKIIGDVRGQGLLVGIELVKDKKTKEPAEKYKEHLFIEKCKEKGLIVEGGDGGMYSSVIVLHPPLIVKKEHIDKALDIINDVVGELQQK